jgi:hypothetical protein
MWHKIHVAAVTGQQMLAFVHYTVHVWENNENGQQDKVVGGHNGFQMPQEL